jgi:hypothetical protein
VVPLGLGGASPSACGRRESQSARGMGSRDAFRFRLSILRFRFRLAIDLPMPELYFGPGRIFFLTYIDIRNRFASVKKRTTVWLPLDLIERLKKLSRKTGAPMAELFRRAVDSYVRRQT